MKIETTRNKRKRKETIQRPIRPIKTPHPFLVPHHLTRYPTSSVSAQNYHHYPFIVLIPITAEANIHFSTIPNPILGPYHAQSINSTLLYYLAHHICIILVRPITTHSKCPFTPHHYYKPYSVSSPHPITIISYAPHQNFQLYLSTPSQNPHRIL